MLKFWPMDGRVDGAGAAFVADRAGLSKLPKRSSTETGCPDITPLLVPACG